MPGVQEPLTIALVETFSQTNTKDESTEHYQSKADSITRNKPAATPQTHRFDPDFTQSVINATGPKASPRLRKVMASLIRHVHDFVRENEITVDEWMAGVEMVSVCPRFNCSHANTLPFRT